MHFPHAIDMNPLRSDNVYSGAICSENQSGQIELLLAWPVCNPVPFEVDENRCYGQDTSPTSCPINQNLHDAGTFCINIKCMHFPSSSHPFFHLTISHDFTMLSPCPPQSVATRSQQPWASRCRRRCCRLPRHFCSARCAAAWASRQSVKYRKIFTFGKKAICEDSRTLEWPQTDRVCVSRCKQSKPWRMKSKHWKDKDLKKSIEKSNRTKQNKTVESTQYALRSDINESKVIICHGPTLTTRTPAPAAYGKPRRIARASAASQQKRTTSGGLSSPRPWEVASPQGPCRKDKFMVCNKGLRTLGSKNGLCAKSI